MPSDDRASMLALWALGLCSDDDERRRWARKQVQRDRTAEEQQAKREKAQAKRERRQARRREATDDP